MTRPTERTFGFHGIRNMTYTLACLLLVTAPSIVAAANFDFPTPSDDRWHYPFNFTPGTRPVATCFGTGGLNGFNDRDGLAVIAWNTSTLIPPGLGAGNYPISSLTVTVTNQPNAAWQIDLTPDEWFTYDLNGDGIINADGIPRGEPGDTDGESNDPDPGRTIELYGAGFGPVFTAVDWVETSFYVGSDSINNTPRDPFPFVFREGGSDMLHIEDHMKGLHNAGLTPPFCGPPDTTCPFTPIPWAVGVPVNYTPTLQTTPFDIVFTINLDQSNGRVRQYFQEGLNAGRVFVIISSGADAVFMSGQATFPTLFMKESTAPGAKPGKLSITLDTCQAGSGDIDCDGDVDGNDLNLFSAVLLGTETNSAFVARSDLDASGAANGLDVPAFVQAFLNP